MKNAFLICALAFSVIDLRAAIELRKLQVEYRETPLGIDVERPRFGWQMGVTAGERGAAQKAYQIVVKAPGGATVWDSAKQDDARSVGIRYAGSALKPATRYRWTVTVWDQSGVAHAAESWFETGLMAPSETAPAWGGAKWIGGGPEDLVLYAPYLAVFDLSYAVTIAPGSSRAGFVYGANDSRLMDQNKNVYNVANKRDQSYVKIELDVSGADTGNAKLNVYRVGYTPKDSATKPIKSFDVKPEVLNGSNKNAEHVVSFRSALGQVTISLDGKTDFFSSVQPPPGPTRGPFGPPQANVVQVNPAGAGGDYLPFGLLCEIGFAMDAGQKATFRDVTVRNNREPRNILLKEAAPRVVSGGDKGSFAVKDPSRNSMPMLRTTFKAAKEVASARLYITSRGIYEVFLNGKRVGDDYYNPGLTQYNLTQLYQTYDVTGMLRPGANALGAMLGEGWWSGLLSFGTVWNHFGDRQSLLAKLAITYKDGSTETVVTNDTNWKYFNDGPVVYSSLDFGEIYDSTKEAAVAGWSTAAYAGKNWKNAVVVPLEGTTFAAAESGPFSRPAPPMKWDRVQLVGQIGNNAGVFQTLKAKSVKEVRPGVFVYDMGQNFVGVPRITLAAGRASAKITLRYAEMLYPKLAESGANVGMIMTENYRAALSTDVYTVKAGHQIFQPKFTSHGYQYIEITGIDKALPLDAVEGVVISSVRELSSSYKSSNEKVNNLWSNLVWSNVDNFLTIPTDCPQRNERMGWSGDISVFSRTATYVSPADQFLTRHMLAMRDTQLPSGKFTDIAPVGGGFGGILWGSAGIVVPWEAYQQYGDLGLLEQHYPAMTAYIDYLETTIDPQTGLSSDAALGDWLGPQNNLLGSNYLATAYHAYDLWLMSRIASALDKPTDEKKFRAMFEKRKAFFNSKFVNEEKKALGTTGGRGGFGGRPGAPLTFQIADSQTAYAVGLGMDLFNAADRQTMVGNLAAAVERENKDDGGVVRPNYSLMTGFIGTSWISMALSNNGLVDQAYRLLLNDKYPSWLYPIDQGATTIWERLNGYTVENGFGGNNSMNSFNHYSFGAVGQWLIAHSLGIQRLEPGFQRFLLQPEPDPTGTITHAEGYFDSVYGRIDSSWKVEGGTLTYQATVPPNTTAILHLPAASKDRVQTSQQDASFLRDLNGAVVYNLPPGTYTFTVAR